MFGIVANIVLQILRSVFGLVPSANNPGSAITFPTTNGVIQVTNTTGTNRLYLAAEDGIVLATTAADPTGVVTSAIVTSTQFRPNNGSNLALGSSVSTSNDNWNGFYQRTTSIITWGADVGLARAAAGVLKVTDSGAGSGWLQNTAGRSVGTAGATNITITPATTGCSVTLVSGRKYKFKLVLWTTTATAADGLRVDFDGGAATMTSFMQNGIVTDTAGVRSLPQTTAIATDVTDTTTTGAAMSVFEGYMVCNVGGTFIPRFAKEADAAGATITLNNAVLMVEDMP